MMNRTDIINLLINYFGYKSYLEIGVRNPNDNFNKINCIYKVGVDIKEIIGPFGSCQFFHGTSNDFFEKSMLGMGTLDDHWGCIFIDGDHRYEQVLRDFQNSYVRLRKNGIIVLHDVNPTNEGSQGPVKKSGDWSGEVWKLWFHLKMFLAFDMFTVDCDYGVGIVRKKPFNEKAYNDKVSKFGDMPNYEWDDFFKNKEEMLDLIEPKAKAIIERMVQ